MKFNLKQEYLIIYLDFIFVVADDTLHSRLIRCARDVYLRNLRKRTPHIFHVALRILSV